MGGPFSIEICAGAGGQALGLESAGFEHLALVEIDVDACKTLRANRPSWNVLQSDIRDFAAFKYRGVDLLAGGLPCPPFSIAGKQLGKNDERNLFPIAFEMISQCRPNMVMIENVRGILHPVFSDYRKYIDDTFRKLGFMPYLAMLNAANFGVPQLRPRVIFIASKPKYSGNFNWPIGSSNSGLTVGSALYSEIKSREWIGAELWKERANTIAPTIVGGSKKHGGPDLGPTRAKRAWAKLGVDGHGIANEPPHRNFVGMPRLTVPMVGILQGFPTSWHFVGGKTTAYRQVGNAFPPPVAKAVGDALVTALGKRRLNVVSAA